MTSMLIFFQFLHFITFFCIVKILVDIVQWYFVATRPLDTSISVAWRCKYLLLSLPLDLIQQFCLNFSVSDNKKPWIVVCLNSPHYLQHIVFIVINSVLHWLRRTIFPELYTHRSRQTWLLYWCVWCVSPWQCVTFTNKAKIWVIFWILMSKAIFQNKRMHCYISIEKNWHLAQNSYLYNKLVLINVKWISFVFAFCSK
jgi:hypothetical protein